MKQTNKLTKQKKFNMINDYVTRLKILVTNNPTFSNQDVKDLEKDFASCYPEVSDYQITLVLEWAYHWVHSDIVKRNKQNNNINQTNKGESK